MLEKDDKIGDYTLIKFLGRGQYGEVWLGEKKLQISKKPVRHALKFLFSDNESIDLEIAEAEIDTWIEASGHPNVISVLDMITYNGHIIIVSEYAEAGSLREWLRRNSGIAPSQKRAIEMTLGILRGLEHLHSRNVVHRDLKPDNILLQGNFPRITDFGISRIISENSTLTNAIGSPAYMSPESFSGNKLPSTDIWSVGVIFYELLSGNLPFTAESVYELKDVIQNSEPNSLARSVPFELREIIRKSLGKKRELRFQTAQEMREELEVALYDLVSKSRKRKDYSTDPQQNISTQSIREKSDSNILFIPESIKSQDVEKTDDISKEKVGVSTLPSRVNLTQLEKQKNSQRNDQTETLKSALTAIRNKGETQSYSWLGFSIATFIGLTMGVIIMAYFIIYMEKNSTSGNQYSFNSASINSPQNSSVEYNSSVSYNSNTLGQSDDSKRIKELESKLKSIEEAAGHTLPEQVDTFYAALNEDKTSEGVIVIYGSDKEMTERELEIRKIISSHKYDVSRIRFLRGNNKAGIKPKFYIVPQGTQAPVR